MSTDIKSKVVSISELTDDNPTLCLSPHRVFGQCYLCEVYRKAEKRERLDKLKCKPRINEEAQEKLKEIKILREDLKARKVEIEKLRHELGFH